ncbi:MAG: SdpI family protein [Ktedonobacteraceae bacterium]
MSLSHDSRDKIRPNPLVRNPTTLLIWAIIAMQIVIAIAAFPFMPAVVPVHWGANGQPNGYSSKLLATLLFPGMSIGISVLLPVLMGISPRLGDRSNVVANARVCNMLMAGITLFLLILQLSTTMVALGMNIGIIFVMNLSMAVLFIFLGNYMGKLRRNFWMGIRTPWTIASDVVWERTHRLGGWLMVTVGLLGIPFSFVPQLRIFGMVVLIVLVAIFLYIYSYLCYRQNTLGDREPLASPFDHTNDE